MTERTGHMGYTSFFLEGGSRCPGRAFGDGRKATVRCSPPSPRANSGPCREFGISRKTGFKLFDHYQEWGIQGLADRSRRPHHYAHKLPFQVENYILNVKREHSTWGARKIRERLIRRFSG